jgi:hypothetical protein
MPNKPLRSTALEREYSRSIPTSNGGAKNDFALSFQKGPVSTHLLEPLCHADAKLASGLFQSGEKERIFLVKDVRHLE